MLSNAQITEIATNVYATTGGMLPHRLHELCRAIEQAARSEALDEAASKSTKPVCEESTFEAAWPDIDRAALTCGPYHAAKSAWMARAALSYGK
jgi:hypothetical protein